MGRLLNRLFDRFIQKGAAVGVLVIAGLIFPAGSKAQSAPMLQTQAEAVSQACVQQLNQPEIDQTIATCQQAVALTQIAGEDRLAAYSLGNLGTLYLQQQAYQQALTVFQQALTIATEIGDRILVTKAFVALGTTHLQIGQPSAALDFYQQALANAQISDDPTGAAIAHYNLGLTYDAVGQHQQSVNAYHSAALIAQEMNDPILETYALNKMKLAQAQSEAQSESGDRSARL